MSTPRRGLGKGLGALLGDEKPLAPAAAERTRGVVEIPVDMIGPNPRQPRATFEVEAQGELRGSIETFGVLVPILVRRRGDRYELIAGERRWRAATTAGLKTIPAIVRDVDDRESLEVAMIENLQRENLDALEEAMGYQHLIEDYEFSHDQIAERVGRTRSTIANALRLLGLSEPVRALVRERSLSAGHARALLAFPEPQRLPLAQRVAAEGLSVRALERLAQRKAAPRKATARAVDGNLTEVADRLRYRLGTHVGFVPGAKGGRIEIRYTDDDDLMRLVDILLGET